MKRQMMVLGIFAAITATSLLSEPAAAAGGMTVANCYRTNWGGRQTPTDSWDTAHNSGFNNVVRAAAGNSNITVNARYQRTGDGHDILDITGVSVNGVSVAQESISYYENSDMGPVEAGCAGFSFFTEKSTAMAYKLLDASGKETGYALKHDCANMIRYVPTVPAWQSNGETEIRNRDTQWVKEHDRSNPMEVNVGEAVQWRHRVNIVGVRGAAFSLKMTTVSKKGDAVLSLTDAATLKDLTLSVHAGGTATTVLNANWQTTTWTVPNEPDAIYCQYFEWTPKAGDDSGKGNSEGNKEQCVKIQVLDVPWRLDGTTRIRPCGGAWSDVDIQVAPNTCVEWAHTLTKNGAAEYSGAVNFGQQRPEGDVYGGLKSGSVPNLPATNPYSLPLAVNGGVNTFTLTVGANQRFCQNIGWTVPGETGKNGMTPRLCASAGRLPEEGKYTSELRACALKERSLLGGTVNQCIDATTSGAVAPTKYAKTQDRIYFKYDIRRTAAFQSRQSQNYKAAPEFDYSRTLCATNTTMGIDCEPLGPTRYTRPTQPGGKVTSKPGYLRPMMEDWIITRTNDCVLSGLQNPLSGLAPANCTAGESELRTKEYYTYQGSGHKVVNADLGLRKTDLTQNISLSDISIRVIKNKARTYTYEYKSRHSARCASDSWYSGDWSCGYWDDYWDEWVDEYCGDDYCSSYAVLYYGDGRLGGNSCYYGCYGVDGPADATATYTDSDNSYIELLPDGPLRAEVSFAIPYNYTIVPQLSLSPATPERIQVGGTEVGYSASLNINPRFNAEVGETYASATRPGTRWAITEFYVGPNRTSNPNPESNYTRTGAGASPCSFYTYDNNGQNGLANVSNPCRSITGTGSLNASSETNAYNLEHGSSFYIGSENPLVADAPIGTKFCVSVAVMDADSTYQNGYGKEVSGNWTITKPECIVIGKYPTVDVLGNGLYSDGRIEGSTFTKQPSGTSSSGAFGSYAEYEVVSNSSIRTFASGAALGAGAGGVPFGGSNSASLLSASLLNGSCQISPLTFRNMGCSTNNLNSNLGQMSGISGSHGLARNIRHRYTNRDDATVVNNGSTINLASYTGRMNYIRANGNLRISGGTIAAGRSVIIDATGEVMIDGNINLNNGPYTDISQVPQVLIFAGGINIAPSVTRVDAWLLAGLNGGTGLINTCNSVRNINALSGNTCGNPLRIDGPVMASRIQLHRTAGAGPGMPNSARPAEVFFLSPASYLWAYNQSANLRQAYLTYAREVAPRY